MQITQNVPRYVFCRGILKELAARVRSASPQSARHLRAIAKEYLLEKHYKQALAGIGRVTIENVTSFRHDVEGHEHLFLDPVRGAMVVAYDLGVGARKKKWYQLDKRIPYRAISTSGMIIYETGDLRVEQTELIHGHTEVDWNRDENCLTTLDWLYKEKEERRPWSHLIFGAALVARGQTSIFYSDIGGTAQAAAWHIVTGAGARALDADYCPLDYQNINGFFQNGCYFSFQQELIQDRVQAFQKALKGQRSPSLSLLGQI